MPKPSTKCKDCKSYNAFCRDCRLARYDKMKEETSNDPLFPIKEGVKEKAFAIVKEVESQLANTEEETSTTDIDQDLKESFKTIVKEKSNDIEELDRVDERESQQIQTHRIANTKREKEIILELESEIHSLYSSHLSIDNIDNLVKLIDELKELNNF